MISEHRRLQHLEAGRKRRLLHYDEVMAYQREWQRNNREKMKAYDDKWRAANPEVAKESDSKKGKKHHKKMQETSPEYRAKNVIKAIKWMKDNPDRSKKLQHAISQRHNARKRGSTIGPIDYDKILIESCGLCGICLLPLGNRIDYDHIVPLARGGTHTQDNIQATHSICNRCKNARLMSELSENQIQSMAQLTQPLQVEA